MNVNIADILLDANERQNEIIGFEAFLSKRYFILVEKAHSGVLR